MLALEKSRVIAECGSGARWSVLSGRRHQGRTVQRAKKQLAARLLVGDAKVIVARFGPTAPIYLHMGRRLDNHHRGGENAEVVPSVAEGDLNPASGECPLYTCFATLDLLDHHPHRSLNAHQPLQKNAKLDRAKFSKSPSSWRDLPATGFAYPHRRRDHRNQCLSRGNCRIASSSGVESLPRMRAIAN